MCHANLNKVGIVVCAQRTSSYQFILLSGPLWFRPSRPLILGMLTFLSEVPDLTLFNPCARSARAFISSDFYPHLLISTRWGDVAGREAPKLLTVLASEPVSLSALPTSLRRHVTTSLPPTLSTFPSQPVDLTFLTLFNPSHLFASSAVHAVNAQHSPLNSFFRRKSLQSSFSLSQVPAFTIFTLKKFLRALRSIFRKSLGFELSTFPSEVPAIINSNDQIACEALRLNARSGHRQFHSTFHHQRPVVLRVLLSKIDAFRSGD
jgi:hypothetical protein